MFQMVTAALFLVLLQPERGVDGGPVRVTIEAHDANTAKRLAKAKYGPSYKVVEARYIGKSKP